jgi:hypothetical protein
MPKNEGCRMNAGFAAIFLPSSAVRVKSFTKYYKLKKLLVYAN